MESTEIIKMFGEKNEQLYYIWILQLDTNLLSKSTRILVVMFSGGNILNATYTCCEKIKDANRKKYLWS